MNEAKIAAIFVQPDGCYAHLECIDAWPESRDARLYDGLLPVVAHPPCQLWGAMAAVNYARWGGEHNRPGNDAGCFASALVSVRRCGGVLEHPAKTKAWAAHWLEKPVGIGWKKTPDGGWVCEVWQAHTVIEPIKRRGYIISAASLLLICYGVGQSELIK